MVAVTDPLSREGSPVAEVEQIQPGTPERRGKIEWHSWYKIMWFIDSFHVMNIQVSIRKRVKTWSKVRPGLKLDLLIVEYTFVKNGHLITFSS